MVVSVVMVTYGHEQFIKQSIEGVLMQDCDFDIELILANDCSPDLTDEVVRGILENHPKSNWIKYTKHPKNIGMISNFMWAAGQATAKYIALCDGDDYWTDPLKLQKQVDFLEANSDYSICFHKVQIIKSNKLISDTIIEKRYENIKKFPATVIDLLKQGNFMHTASVVFRNNIRYFPMEFAYSPVGDYFLHIINAQYGYIKRLDEVMAVYRDGVGIYSTLSSENMAKKILQYNSCILSYLSNPEQKEVLLKRQMAIISGIEIIQKGQYLTIENLHSELSFKNILNVLIRKIKNKFTF